jgi:hypothetical protein
MEGMVLEESWTYYTSIDPSGNDISRQTDNLLPWLIAKRGGYHLLRLLMVSIGSTPALINALCIGIQLVNILLFAVIVLELTGPARLFPILMVAFLYPFASSIHFWQAQLVHHVAVLFFLIALALFLRVGWSQRPSGSEFLLYGLPSLVCFWLSLVTMEHAILTPLLFLYLALYHLNGRMTLLKFKRYISAPVGFALCYLVLSLLFIGIAIHDGHARLNFLSPTNVARFSELASAAHVPVTIVKNVVIAVNATVFMAGALFANSIGVLAYPVIVVSEHASVLQAEVGQWGLAMVLVSCLGIWGLYVTKSIQPSVQDAELRFLLAVGLVWALLCYLPLSSSFAYPQVVGQTADRVNALAMFGVSLCLGAGVAWGMSVIPRLRQSFCWLTLSGCALVITILLLNLYLQREYWIEGYQKEQAFVTQMLKVFDQESINGRRPVIFLDRDRKPESVRAKLNGALKEPEVVGKLLGVARVVLARHFTREGQIEVTSFHFGGIPLFGATPDATYVFLNYAGRLSLSPPPIYKIDFAINLRDEPDRIVVGYDGGPERTYLKQDYEPIVVKLRDSFFRFRGAPAYWVGDRPPNL